MKFILKTLLLMGLSLNSAYAGLVSSVFDEHEMDLSLGCNRILLKGGSQNPNTAILVPHIIPGSLLEGKDAYTIRNNPTPQGDKKYLLQIRIFFPSDDDLALANRPGISKMDLNTCKWDHVKSVLNRKLPDSEKIKTFTNASLSAIEMTIPGIEATASLGAINLKDGEIQILEYSGKFLTLTFPINEKERTYFQENVVPKNGVLKNGVSAMVRQYFQTRKRESSFTVKMDREEFLGNFNGQFNAAPVKFLTKVQLSAAIQTASQNTKIMISQEGRASEDEQKLKTQIAQQILSQLSSALIKPEESQSTGGKSFEKPADKTISFDLAVQTISRSVSFSFTSVNYSDPVTAKVDRQLDLSSYATNDPNIIEVKLIPRESDPATGIDLKAGQMISIAQASFQDDEINYETDKTYISKSQLNRYKFRDNFPFLRDEDCLVDDITLNDETFVTNKRTFWCPHRFRWGYILKNPVRNVVRSGTPVLQVDKLEDYPVFISFDGINKSNLISLKKLQNANNEYFSSYFEAETGRFFILAKRNLGQLFMRMRAKEDTPYLKISKSNVITESIFQEDYARLGKVDDYKEVSIKTIKEFISNRRRLTFYVSRPQTPKPNETRFLMTIAPSVPLQLK